MPDPATPHGRLQTFGDPVVIGQPLSGAALLAAWEIGVGEPPPARALAMLRVGCPSLDLEDAATLPITLRDHALLALHAASFGSSLPACASCASCGERLEFVMPVQQIANSLLAAKAKSTLTQANITVRLRLANTHDAMDAAATADLETARRLLLARCAAAVDEDGRIVAIPEPMADAALDRLDAMHEAAEITLTLSCPACDVTQAVHFDIASFLWSEVRHTAQRLLDEVHELAWAYGWSDDAILAMTAVRRQAYLDRVRA